MTVDLETIRERVGRGNYFVKSHAVIHASKEGFNEPHMVQAILNGKIIEVYPTEQRVLVCGQANLTESIRIYLHVVCAMFRP